MYRENPTPGKRRYKNGVIAALEICDEKRAQGSGFEPAPDSSARRYAVDRAAAIIEAAALKIGGNDLSALEAVCASQMLALDVIFNEFAREAAKWKSLSQPSMKMALRAQSQCRATLKTLASLSGQKPARKKSQNFDEQTIESGRIAAQSIPYGFAAHARHPISKIEQTD